jgi:uncharacterized protein (DUF58 family)
VSTPRQGLAQRLGDVRLHWLILVWLLTTIAIALNRGIGLLWGVAWLLAAALVVAAAFPHLQLRGVRARRELPPNATAGEPCELRYTLDSGAWPRYGLELLDRLGVDDAAVLAAFVERTRGRDTLRLAWTPRVRGLRTFGDFALQSRFPLDVTRAQRTIAAPAQELLVYPASVRLKRLPLDAGDAVQADRRSPRERGGRDEYLGSRAYRHGDEWRTIDWRATARSDALTVREYERATERTFWIWLELARSEHRGRGADGTFETMFTLAHSALLRAQADGCNTGLVYRGASGLDTIGAGRDRDTVERMRDALARVGAADVPPLANWIERETRPLPRGGTWLVFLADPARRGALASAVRARSAVPLIVEFDRSFGAADAAPVATRGARFDGGAWVASVSRGMDLSETF